MYAKKHPPAQCGSRKDAERIESVWAKVQSPRKTTIIGKKWREPWKIYEQQQKSAHTSATTTSSRSRGRKRKTTKNTLAENARELMRYKSTTYKMLLPLSMLPLVFRDPSRSFFPSFRTRPMHLLHSTFEAWPLLLLFLFFSSNFFFSINSILFLLSRGGQ